jgi:subtilisin family serine protease
MEKEYNVILKKGVDYTQFGEEMITITDKDNIPNREIEIANSRIGSYRQTHYYLTDVEADEVRNHPDVLAVEIPPENRDDIVLMPYAFQSGSFQKTTSDSGAFLNYGLLRCNSSTNNYGTSDFVEGTYDYILAGEGVDVVIQDSGIQVDHPEFEDEYGNSRVVELNWADASGLSFTQNANFYRDFDGHGTHVAGIAAGKTYGWAKKAAIYSVKVSGLEGSGDGGTGISTTYCFDCIKLWHRNKPTNPETGLKRPTIVNMSWGYGTSFASVSSINYRGTTYSSANDANFTNTSSNWSHLENTYGMRDQYYVFNGHIMNTRIASVDTDVEELVDEGVHVCIAAGNRSFKIDKPGGVDYNNTVTTNLQTNHNYHRGSSPSSETAILVGSADKTVYSTTLDQKATYSETGPGVDIYAPGTYISSACSNTNRFSAPAYYADSNFTQVNISGTSMASPQVCGLGALHLELDPGLTPAELKLRLERQSTDLIYSSGSNPDDGFDYGINRNLLGGEKRFMLNKYVQRTAGSIENVNLSVSYTLV